MCFGSSFGIGNSSYGLRTLASLCICGKLMDEPSLFLLFLMFSLNNFVAWNLDVRLAGLEDNAEAVAI